MHQAEALADLLRRVNVDRIISSPSTRAIQSIAPLAERLSLGVETDERLSERILSAHPHPDWRNLLRNTFVNLNLSYEGGESSQTAMDRAVSVVDDVLSHSAQTTVVVSHGCLITLLLKHFDQRFGFPQWAAMTSPDVYRVTNIGGSQVERIWR